jgi:hypothetical protein
VADVIILINKAYNKTSVVPTSLSAQRRRRRRRRRKGPDIVHRFVALTCFENQVA